MTGTGDANQAAQATDGHPPTAGPRRFAGNKARTSKGSDSILCAMRWQKSAFVAALLAGSLNLAKEAGDEGQAL
jgi:hypothetical protein